MCLPRPAFNCERKSLKTGKVVKQPSAERQSDYNEGGHVTAFEALGRQRTCVPIGWGTDDIKFSWSFEFLVDRHLDHVLEGGPAT